MFSTSIIAGVLSSIYVRYTGAADHATIVN